MGLCETSNLSIFTFTIVSDLKFCVRFSSSCVERAFSCDVIAAMLEGKNNTFSLLWEIRSIFMQNCFIVSALQHGCRENSLQNDDVTLYNSICFLEINLSLSLPPR